MKAPEIYIVISFLILALIVLMVIFGGRKNRQNRLTPLVGLAFGFVVAGLFFEEEPYIGYGLFIVAAILAIIDIVRKTRKKEDDI